MDSGVRRMTSAIMSARGAHEKKSVLLPFAVVAVGLYGLAPISCAHREARSRCHGAPDAHRAAQRRHPAAYPPRRAPALSRGRARPLAQAPEHAACAAA